MIESKYKSLSEKLLFTVLLTKSIRSAHDLFEQLTQYESKSLWQSR